MLRDPVKMLTLSALVVVTGGTLACSHVGQDEFDSTIAQVRRESREGDEALSRSLNGRIDNVDARVSAVDGRVASMERDMAALTADFDVMVDRMETAMRFNTPIFFATDDSGLRDEDQIMLDRFSAIVHDYYPSSVITVEGFTDPSGSAAYNLQLGQRRAESVKEYLVTYGQLSGEQVRTVSYGEDSDRLVTSDGGDAGWENRRVVLVIDYHDTYGGMVAASSYPQ
jgi:peptidoglycan-associated lipoprotein